MPTDTPGEGIDPLADCIAFCRLLTDYEQRRIQVLFDTITDLLVRLAAAEKRVGELNHALELTDHAHDLTASQLAAEVARREAAESVIRRDHKADCLCVYCEDHRLAASGGTGRE